jgi:hypothetical protein
MRLQLASMQINSCTDAPVHINSATLHKSPANVEHTLAAARCRTLQQTHQQ